MIHFQPITMFYIHIMMFYIHITMFYIHITMLYIHITMFYIHLHKHKFIYSEKTHKHLCIAIKLTLNYRP